MKTFKYFMTLGTIGLVALGSAQLVQAAGGDKDIFVGALIGLTDVSNNVGTGLGFEAEAGYFFLDPFGFGIYVRRGNHTADITSVFYGGEFFYRLNMVLQGLRAGAILGAGSFNANGVGGNSALEIGFKGAYDYFLPIDLPISIGADIALTWTKPGDSTLTMFTPMLTGRWWF